MKKIMAHARIPVFPYALSLQGARLDSLREETAGRRHDLVLDYHELSPIIPPEIFKRNEKIYERIQGNLIPRRLRFAGIQELKLNGVYEKLDQAPLDHPAREIRDMLRWIQPRHSLTFYIVFNSSPGPDDVRFYAQRVLQEKRTGRPVSVSLERDWSPAPPTRAGIVPFTKKLYERFGGDPVTIHLDGHVHHRRLFIGSLEIQPKKRPGVDWVLNLGEDPSRWAKGRKLPDCDRWVNKGEGVNGMSLKEICYEAEWVIERLRAGKRVLIHCVAGMNRSSTICCAVLMQLEGLSAERALERVREHHPWARPDSGHWLRLRWLAK